MNIVLAIIILLGYTIAVCGVHPCAVPVRIATRRVVFGQGEREHAIPAFIAIAALAFVGAAPLVADKTDLTYKVHCVAAVVCAVCSQLVLVFNHPLFLAFWIPWLFCFVDVESRGQSNHGDRFLIR